MNTGDSPLRRELSTLTGCYVEASPYGYYRPRPYVYVYPHRPYGYYY